MDEHRREERKKLMTFTAVYDINTASLMGYLADLTLQGAMLVGNKPQDVDKHLTLAIDFHETPEVPATRMVLPVRVVWCRQEKRTIFYNCGVEFLEISDENIKVITAILKRYQFSQDQSD
jgi:hypothetical protein